MFYVHFLSVYIYIYIYIYIYYTYNYVYNMIKKYVLYENLC